MKNFSLKTVLILFLLNSCAPYDYSSNNNNKPKGRYYDKYLGFTENQLTDERGIPSQKYVRDDGTFILEFLQTGIIDGGSSIASTDIFGNTHISGGGVNSFSCKSTFFFNTEKIVYDHRFEGINCKLPW